VRHLTLTVSLAISAGLSPLRAAESADKILAQHIAALGGAKLLKARAAMEYRGEARDDAAGERGSFTLAIRTPNLIYFELAASSHGWSEADNGKSAWRRDGVQGLRTISGADSKELRTMGYFLNNRFVDYRKDKWSPTYLGNAMVDGRQADVIEMANEASELAGARCKFYFDSATHMLLKQEQPDGADYIAYGDYRPVNGVSEPFHLILHRASQTLDVVFAEVRHNPSLDSHTFDYPGAAISDPPDMAKLFEDLGKHQNDLRKLRRAYSCTLDEVSEEVDGKGKVTKTATERYYLLYLGNRQFRKHIATNGQPLSEPELKKEDERIAKEQKQWEERRKQAQARREAAAAKAGQSAPQQNSPPQNQGDDDMVRDILKVMRFSSFRREPFRGREVLVFDFSPKAGYKPHGLGETLVSKLVGTMWVDESDHEVARVQARSAGSFKIAGGLVASLDSGASILVEQEKVNNEVWMPVIEEVHLSAHLLLVKSERANETDRYSDYKKFTADSKVIFGEVPH
jgi:hypothetical protein